MKRVGFVTDGLVPGVRRGLSSYFRGCRSSSSVSEMRFSWVADWVHRHPETGFVYELYRPWCRYDAVVFLKSMGGASKALARRLRQRRVPTVFDCNVDYFTPAAGTFYYAGMAPTAAQRQQAIDMALLSEGVIADSARIAEGARPHQPRVTVVEDNVRDEMLVDGSRWTPGRGPLSLVWCGEACKLFELLRIGDELIAMGDRIRLRIVTSPLEGMSAIFPEHRTALERLLDRVPNEILRFKSIADLLSLYDEGGICISPRYLDNTYNPGHTEWKIALAMARGRFVLCSEQPSYVAVHERSGGRGCRICRTGAEWRVALDSILSGGFDWLAEQAAACEVVRRHYTTSVLAARHVDFIRRVLGEVKP